MAAVSTGYLHAGGCVEIRWVLLFERKLLDGLEDRLRSGRVVLPSVVTDLTPQMFERPGAGVFGSWRKPCQGADLRECRTSSGPQTAILDCLGSRVSFGDGLKRPGWDSCPNPPDSSLQVNE